MNNILGKGAGKGGGGGGTVREAGGGLGIRAAVEEESYFRKKTQEQLQALKEKTPKPQNEVQTARNEGSGQEA
uniref:ATPase inhibitor, mitochondrial n=1 Tax=Denticeps clupeoides TaxID=299321 RepID=A0AAY4C3E1_9TELE